MLKQFFPTILRAERVEFSNQCLKALATVLKKKYLLSLASHIEFVRVQFFDKIVDSDKILCELESIVIQHRSEEYESVVKKMRSVEISCFSGDKKLLFLVMEFLLEHASSLELMVIGKSGGKKKS